MTGPRVTADDLAGLRRAAEAATPGPWERPTVGAWPGHVLAVGKPLGEKFICDARHYSDAHFIAAADPATVLALLDEIDRLREENANLRDTADTLLFTVENLGESYRLEVERRETASLHGDAERHRAESAVRDLAAAQTQLAAVRAATDGAARLTANLAEIQSRLVMDTDEDTALNEKHTELLRDAARRFETIAAALAEGPAPETTTP